MKLFVRHILHFVKQTFRRVTNPEVGDIVVLHRVCEPDFILQRNAALEITPLQLKKIIRHYKQLNYCFVSLDEFVRRKEKFSFFSFQKMVTFTLDDGYRDNYEIAYPIFRHFDVPFTVYLSNSYLKKEALMWWYILEDWLMKQDTITLNNKVISIASMEEKNDVFNHIHSDLSKQNTSDVIPWFEEHGIKWKECNEALNERLCITPTRLKEMAKDNLVTIGAHTNSHARLSALSVIDQKEEISSSISDLSTMINTPVKHFSYPYGDYNAETCRLLNDLSVLSAVTVCNSSVFRKTPNLQLPRKKVI